MKRLLAVLFACFVLLGCSAGNEQMNQVLEFRSSLLSAAGCTFEATVTADYGDKLYTFTMACETNAEGGLTFSVEQPESIAGITGTVSEIGGKLTFDDEVLAFETIADGQITPISAPWLLIHTLRSGYIKSCGMDSDGLHIQIDDSYREDALQTDIWTDENTNPTHAEILWKGKRILSIDVSNFNIV